MQKCCYINEVIPATNTLELKPKISMLSNANRLILHLVKSLISCNVLYWQLVVTAISESTYSCHDFKVKGLKSSLDFTRPEVL